MADSDYIFESGDKIQVGSSGETDFLYASGNQVPNKGKSEFVFESGVGLGGSLVPPYADEILVCVSNPGGLTEEYKPGIGPDKKPKLQWVTEIEDIDGPMRIRVTEDYVLYTDTSDLFFYDVFTGELLNVITADLGGFNHFRHTNERYTINNQNDVIVAADLKTQEVLWENDFDSTTNTDDIDTYGIIEGDKIMAENADNDKYHKVDIPTGDIVWTVTEEELGRASESDTYYTNNIGGFHLYNGVLYGSPATLGGTGPAIYAIDYETGDFLWRRDYETDDDPFYFRRNIGTNEPDSYDYLGPREIIEYEDKFYSFSGYVDEDGLWEYFFSFSPSDGSGIDYREYSPGESFDIQTILGRYKGNVIIYGRNYPGDRDEILASIDLEDFSFNYLNRFSEDHFLSRIRMFNNIMTYGVEYDKTEAMDLETGEILWTAPDRDYAFGAASREAGFFVIDLDSGYNNLEPFID